MDKKEIITKLKHYKKLLSEHIDFEEMILFGSYARNTAGSASDMDVAIIVETLHHDDYFAIRPLLWKIRRQVDDRIEPVLLDKHHDESGFLSEIQNYGIQI